MPAGCNAADVQAAARVPGSDRWILLVAARRAATTGSDRLNGLPLGRMELPADCD
jgi:hypothetical protein